MSKDSNIKMRLRNYSQQSNNKNDQSNKNSHSNNSSNNNNNHNDDSNVHDINMDETQPVSLLQIVQNAATHPPKAKKLSSRRKPRNCNINNLKQTVRDDAKNMSRHGFLMKHGVSASKQVAEQMAILAQIQQGKEDDKKPANSSQTSSVMGQAIQLAQKGDEKGIVLKESNKNNNTNISDTNSLNEHEINKNGLQKQQSQDVEMDTGYKIWEMQARKNEMFREYGQIMSIKLQLFNIYQLVSNIESFMIRMKVDRPDIADDATIVLTPIFDKLKQLAMQQHQSDDNKIAESFNFYAKVLMSILSTMMERYSSTDCVFTNKSKTHNENKDENENNDNSNKCNNNNSSADRLPDTDITNNVNNSNLTAFELRAKEIANQNRIEKQSLPATIHTSEDLQKLGDYAIQSASKNELQDKKHMSNVLVNAINNRIPQDELNEGAYCSAAGISRYNGDAWFEQRYRDPVGYTKPVRGMNTELSDDRFSPYQVFAQNGNNDKTDKNKDSDIKSSYNNGDYNMNHTCENNPNNENKNMHNNMIVQKNTNTINVENNENNKWNCSLCTFENWGELNECEMCSTLRNDHDNEDNDEEDDDDVLEDISTTLNELHNNRNNSNDNHHDSKKHINDPNKNNSSNNSNNNNNKWTCGNCRYKNDQSLVQCEMCHGSDFESDESVNSDDSDAKGVTTEESQYSQHTSNKTKSKNESKRSKKSDKSGLGVRIDDNDETISIGKGKKEKTFSLADIEADYKQISSLIDRNKIIKDRHVNSTNQVDKVKDFWGDAEVLYFYCTLREFVELMTENNKQFRNGKISGD